MIPIMSDQQAKSENIAWPIKPAVAVKSIPAVAAMMIAVSRAEIASSLGDASCDQVANQENSDPGDLSNNTSSELK